MKDTKESRAKDHPFYLGDCDACGCALMDHGKAGGGTLEGESGLAPTVTYQPGGPGSNVTMKLCQYCWMMGAVWAAKQARAEGGARGGTHDGPASS